MQNANAGKLADHWQYNKTIRQSSCSDPTQLMEIPRKYPTKPNPNHGWTRCTLITSIFERRPVLTPHPNFLADCASGRAMLNCCVCRQIRRHCSPLQNKVRQYALSVAGPEVWNRLPQSVRSADTVRQFRRLLKTHYFQLHFGPNEQCCYSF